MDPVLRIGNACDFERMPNGRLRIVPRRRIMRGPISDKRPMFDTDDDHILELDLTEVYKLTEWLNKFPKSK